MDIGAGKFGLLDTGNNVCVTMPLGSWCCRIPEAAVSSQSTRQWSGPEGVYVDVKSL